MRNEPHVMVVDDDLSLQAFVGGVLKHFGYDVTPLTSAENLVQEVRSTQPDIVLLDYQMPEVDGLSALRTLRSKRVLVPVVVMTSNSDQGTAVQFFRAGANDFLGKPLDADYLEIVVRRTISHHSRNLIEMMTEMSRFMSHDEGCHTSTGPCTCGMESVAARALKTATQLMREG